jgi:mono/diheme cytochrome c family protein
MRNTLYSVCLSVAGLVLAAQADAQGLGFGAYEYQNSCVQCHGVSGKGDGPVTDFLPGAEVPDLTVLKKNNGGVFPVQAVFDTISGDDVASAHGTRDMPIWGDRFRDRAMSGEAGWTPEQGQVYAGSRILALIEYLASLQE